MPESQRRNRRGQPTTSTNWRVLIDCTAMPSTRGGVGRYLEGILHAMPEDGPAITITVQARDADIMSKIAPHAQVISVHRWLTNRVLRLAWEQFGLPLVARKTSARVIHSPHYTFPLLTSRRRVVTLHDATFFSHPDMHSRLKARFFRAWTRRAWKLADIVITPSQATASEIKRYLGSPRRRPVVALHGVNTELFKPPTEAQVAALRNSLGLANTDHWIAFLGTIEPRKNLPHLMRAHATVVAEKGQDAPLLLIAGGRGWDKEAAQLLDVASTDRASRVRELGYLPIEQLPSLLGGADVVVYPSEGEGFGLPVLEAMAVGSVVLTTRKLALPEVGGDAVAYTEPLTENITESLKMLLSHSGVSAQLRTAAVERASELTWAASARVHTNAYRAAVTNIA